MCGITAFLSFNQMSDTIIKKLQSSNKEMNYRGPDENDVWYNDNVALAHVRLSIIGLSNGHQPIFNEDKSIVLICNGEIYNYKDLREDLKKKGHFFKTDSDTEVIVHLYEEYGENLCEKLDGMFAFCLYDISKDTFFVARDRAGKKPLYYAATSQGIVFSSELKIIKNIFLSSAEINYEVLRQIQQNSYSISPNETYIKGLFKVPYACFASIDRRNLMINFKRYYVRNIKNSFDGTYDEACQEVKRLLYRAVEKRLESEVPVALLLSAGLDSSIIACIARDFISNVNVISAGYSGRFEVDERNEAKKLSKEKLFNWDEIEMNENDFDLNLHDILYHLDEPNGDVSMFAQWEIYKKAKNKGYRVLLSGNGGDELFYGYPVHNDYAKGLQSLNRIKKYFPIHKKLNFLKLLIVQMINTIFQKNEFNFDKINMSNEFPVLNELTDLALLESIPLIRSDWQRNESISELDNVYHYLNYAWLTNNCYFLADKLAMANSIEVRCPFADLDLITFVDSLPMKFKFKDGKPKQLLKDSMKDILPSYVIERKKTGFTPPHSFVASIICKYETKYFKSPITTFPQLVTDYFAQKV